MTLLEEATAFIEATSIQLAEHDNDFWLNLAAPYYVGYNLGHRRRVNAGVSVIDRNTERWRDARADLLARLKAALVEESKPTRWRQDMRDWEDTLTLPYTNPTGSLTLTRLTCWAYISDIDACIRERGHDNNAHEPTEAKS